MNEFLTFRKMITPIFIQVIFWIAAIGAFIAGLVMMFQGGVYLLFGFLYMILGPLVVRIYCELVILLFKVYEELQAIRGAVAPPATHGFPVAPLPGSTPGQT